MADKATVSNGGGTVVSFSNTPQAQNDLFVINDPGTDYAISYVIKLDVMANDLGGNAKSLYSVDDGVSASTATKVAAPADLLSKDAVGAFETGAATSLHGAKIGITADGKVGLQVTQQ